MRYVRIVVFVRAGSNGAAELRRFREACAARGIDEAALGAPSAESGPSYVFTVQRALADSLPFVPRSSNLGAHRGSIVANWDEVDAHRTDDICPWLRPHQRKEVATFGYLSGRPIGAAERAVYLEELRAARAWARGNLTGALSIQDVNSRLRAGAGEAVKMRRRMAHCIANGGTYGE